MQYLLFLSLLFPTMAFSKADVNFNKALQDDLKTEIKNDDFKYKTKSHRAPASVESEVTPHVIKETSKIDKTVRQIGPNQW